MKDILSVENMRMSDAHTIENGTSGRKLMQRAAEGVYRNVSWQGPVAIVCGSGNNAGDGYALALLLHEAGIDVSVLRLSDRFSDDGRYYYDKCVTSCINDGLLDNNTDMSVYRTVVDCLLGTGFRGSLREDIANAINQINRSNAYIVSVDINSGLNGDSGIAGSVSTTAMTGTDGGLATERLCVKSDITIAIGGYKPGHFLNMAKDVMKSVISIDIGIEPVEKAFGLLEAADIKTFIPPRANMSNKGTYGYTALIGGSLRYSGAIRLAYMANAAMRSGAGVVKVALPGSLAHDVIPHILESTVFPMSDDNGEMICNEDELCELTANVRTVAFGMGIGVTAETEKILIYLLTKYTGRLIIDADGLNILSTLDADVLRQAVCRDIVLTPHIREFSRLTHTELHRIQDSPIDIASRYAGGTGTILLLKGPSTIITNGRDVYITDRGCPGMATAGSGDVLSGILAATCGYIPDIMKAVAAGAYIGGRAGELAEERYGSVSMTAGDTAGYIADVVRSLC